MNKKKIVLIIGVILIIGVPSTIIVNHYISVEREFELNNTPNQLKAVLARCGCYADPDRDPDHLCLASFVDWQNSTHYIDVRICTFLDIVEGSPTYGLPIEYDKPICLPRYDENMDNDNDCTRVIIPDP